MTRLVRLAFLGTLLAGAAAEAQTPPARTEADLIAAGQQAMTGPEIVALLQGNTGYYLFITKVGGVKGGTVTPAYYRDARVRLLRDGRGKVVEGNWWVDGKLACAEQQYVAQGHVCFTYYKVGPVTYVCYQPAGACSMVVRMVPGNPEDM